MRLRMFFSALSTVLAPQAVAASGAPPAPAHVVLCKKPRHVSPTTLTLEMLSGYRYLVEEGLRTPFRGCSARGEN